MTCYYQRGNILVFTPAMPRAIYLATHVAGALVSHYLAILLFLCWDLVKTSSIYGKTLQRLVNGHFLVEFDHSKTLHREKFLLGWL